MNRPKKLKQKPGPKVPNPPAAPQPMVVRLVLAWIGVLAPLGWGIFKTLQKAALLLQI